MKFPLSDQIFNFSYFTRAFVPLSLFLAFACPALPAEGPVGSNLPTRVAKSGEMLITDISSKPVPGVALMIQPRPLMLLPENLTETTATVSSAGGQLRTPEPEVGGTLFVLRKPGYQSTAFNASKVMPRHVTLRPGRNVTGKVFTANGTPISGAWVGPVSMAASTTENIAPPRQSTLLPRIMTRSRRDGSFNLSGLPVDAIAIQFSAPGYTPRRVVFGPGDSEMKIALDTGGAIISGTVLGSSDRATQAGVPISATDGQLLLYTKSDAEGKYMFDNLPNGTWKIRPAGGGPLSGTQSRAKVVQIDKPDQVIDLPLVLNQGILLAGRAVDAVTSQGLGGINITLSGYGGAGAKAVLTDPDGSFAFENLDSLQGVIIRFDPLKFVYLLPGGAYRDYFDISKAGDTDFDLTTITIPLHRRLPVAGQVRNAQNQPVPDVEVRLQSLNTITSTPSKSGPGPLTFSTSTNDVGEFHAGVYPAGPYKVWAQQEKFVSQVESIEAYTTAPAPNLTLRLTRAAQLDGMVTDAHDTPVTAAIVIAWPADSPEPTEDPIPGRENYTFSKTDSNGHFVLSGLRGEPLVVRASHPDFVQDTRVSYNPSSVQPGTSSSILLKFPGGGELSVFVSDEEGNAISGAEVQVDYLVGMDGQRAKTKTDSYGRAFIGALPATRVEKIMVNHPAFAPFESDGAVTLPQSHYQVTLKKRGSLVAHVKGDNPHPGVSIEILLLQAPQNSSSTQPPEDNAFNQTSRVSVVAGEAVFPNLPPGWYKAAYADSGAYADSDAVLMEAGKGDREVELTLPHGNHLTGIIKDKQTGEGIPGANLTLRPAVDSQIVVERSTQNVISGDGGTFELYNVSGGELQVRVIAADYPEYQGTVTFTPGEDVVIEMTNEPASLKGHVTADGSPVTGALLVLSKKSGDHSPVATAVSDDSGAYNMDGFSMGSYLLSAEAPIGEGENISRKTIPVDIENGDATKDVAFEALVSVHGEVRLAGKVPRHESGAATTVLFTGTQPGMDSKMIIVDDKGNYSTQLEPGTYNVSLEDREGHPVEVPSGSTARLDLDF